MNDPTKDQGEDDVSEMRATLAEMHHSRRTNNERLIEEAMKGLDSFTDIYKLAAKARFTIDELKALARGNDGAQLTLVAICAYAEGMSSEALLKHVTIHGASLWGNQMWSFLHINRNA